MADKKNEAKRLKRQLLLMNRRESHICKGKLDSFVLHRKRFLIFSALNFFRQL